MPMRLSGLMSGMDTESVIQQLVAVKRMKVDDAKKAQTKLQWKQDAWKTLNSKILKLYNGVLGTSMRFQSSYMKKVTKVSNSSVVSVITGDGAMNSVQSLKVKQMAQSAYLTGAEVTGKDGAKVASDTKLSDIEGLDLVGTGKFTVKVGGEEKQFEVTGDTTVSQFVQSLRDAGLNASFDATNQRFYIASKDTGTANDFSLIAENGDAMAMMDGLGLAYVDKNGGVKAYYEKKLSDLKERREAIPGERQGLIDKLKELKEQYDLDIEIDEEDFDASAAKEKIAELLENDEEGEYADLAAWSDSWDALEEEEIQVASQIKEIEGEGGQGGLLAGLNEWAELAAEEDPEKPSRFAVKNAAQDAEIELNGVKYTGSKNTFEINGLTLTVNATTTGDETVTLTTQDDTDGIYDMIKGFIKEYSELINEMDKLYNAGSSRGYEPLTSEEKEAMSESEIEEWETKIKDSLLRKDSTLSTVSNALKQIMSSGITVNGKTMYLSDFGISTLGYFTAADNEKNAYHIDGDPDDPNTAANADKLRAMIASDPQTVIDFFVGLSRNMYSELTDRMARTDYSSGYTIYEDIRMQKEYDSYTSKIADLEKRLADYEDKWYQKFAQMETALSKLQSNASAVTALLGG